MVLSQAKQAMIAPLRVKLNTLRSHQWVEAQQLLNEIQDITGGRRRAKLAGTAAPRVCKYCGYYGHTREHCKQRDRDDDTKIERSVRAERVHIDHIHKAMEAQRADRERREKIIRRIFAEVRAEEIAAAAHADNDGT